MIDKTTNEFTHYLRTPGLKKKRKKKIKLLQTTEMPTQWFP
jgi:hypothetical protein